MVDVLDAARYIISLSYGKRKYSLTHLKLQKILYLSQGWSYVWDNEAAFDDTFSAWAYGPVNERVYEAFKKYGHSEIPADEGCSSLQDKVVAETLESVWAEYGKKPAYVLVELIKQMPWKEAFSSGNEISNDSIKRYFQSTFRVG